MKDPTHYVNRDPDAPQRYALCQGEFESGETEIEQSGNVVDLMWKARRWVCGHPDRRATVEAVSGFYSVAHFSDATLTGIERAIIAGDIAPDGREYSYAAVPSLDPHGTLDGDWPNELSPAGFSEPLARQYAHTYRFQGYVIRETREWSYGDSGWHETPLEARTAYYDKHGAPGRKGTRMVCAECGSENVKVDAWASWNSELANWEVESTQDAGWCDQCEGETRVVQKGAAA